MSNPLDPVAALAGAVPGVVAATPDAAGAALRIRLDPGADGADVALAVGRLLVAASVHAVGLPVSGVVASPSAMVPAPRHAARATVVRQDVHSDGPVVTVAIDLGCEGRTGHGSAHSSLTTTGLRRAMAVATLRATEALCRRPVHLELDLVERSEAGQVPVVVVHATLVSGDGVQPLVGSAAVRDDEAGAVVRAALDAVNRRLGALLHDEEGA